MANKTIKGFDINEKFVLNPVIYCKCGCGETLLEYDQVNRPRKYIFSHYQKTHKQMFGKHLSKETKHKLSITLTGRKISEEHRKNISKANIGKKLSEETKEKLRITNTGKKLTPETKEKISNTKKFFFINGGKPSNGMKGKHQSEETKKILREKSLGKNNPMWGRIGKDNPNYGKKLSKEHIEKLRVINIGSIRTPESKEKMRVAAYNRPITNEMFKDTKPERMLRCILGVNCIPYETQKSLYGRPDIFIEPNICIFEDGDYHHANPDYLRHHKGCPNYLFNKFGKVTTSQQKWNKDEKVTKTLQDQGYKVIRIWEHEVYEDPLGCLKKMRGEL